MSLYISDSFHLLRLSTYMVLERSQQGGVDGVVVGGGRSRREEQDELSTKKTLKEAVH